MRAVTGVASLAVGAMQRQREGNLAISKLTWTDAGGPAGNVCTETFTEEAQKESKHRHEAE